MCLLTHGDQREVSLRCPSSGAVHLGFGAGFLTGLEAVKVRLTACEPQEACLCLTARGKGKYMLSGPSFFYSFKFIVGSGE